VGQLPPVLVDQVKQGNSAIYSFCKFLLLSVQKKSFRCFAETGTKYSAILNSDSAMGKLFATALKKNFN
jgi:hypothetical protein